MRRLRHALRGVEPQCPWCGAACEPILPDRWVAVGSGPEAVPTVVLECGSGHHHDTSWPSVFEVKKTWLVGQALMAREKGRRSVILPKRTGAADIEFVRTRWRLAWRKRERQGLPPKLLQLDEASRRRFYSQWFEGKVDPLRRAR